MYSPSTKRHLKKNPLASLQEIQCQEEAACFARCLLMPEEAFVKIWNALNEIYMFPRFGFRRKQMIKEMAIIFALEIEEIIYRLKELKLYYR